LVTEIGKRKIIATILTIVIWGLGHAYIKRIKRGVGLFFLGLAIMFAVSFVIPWPYMLFVGLGYIIWLIYDVFRIMNMEYSTARQGGDTVEFLKVQCKKCGNMNREGTNYCVKCGSLLQ
jgi:hypothetical protein